MYGDITIFIELLRYYYLSILLLALAGADHLVGAQE